MGCTDYRKQLIHTWGAAHCMMKKTTFFFSEPERCSLGLAAESSTAAADGGQPFNCDKWPLKVREFSQ